MSEGEWQQVATRPPLDQEKMRREMDEAMERANTIVLRDAISGMENPLLETALELAGAGALHGRWGHWSVAEALLYARRKLVGHYAWAIPDERALVMVGSTGSVVEIGAGGGYWAALLRARGVEVFAYDPRPGTTSKKVWTDVLIGRTRPVERHPGSTLFLCWPEYTSRFAEIALLRHLRSGGTRVAYVGEYEGGCCAEDGFFELLSEKFEEVESAHIPQFPGLHDYLTIYDRKD